VAYDSKLAERIRSAFAARADVKERKMFGGVAFLLNGNMCCGVHRTELIVRLDRGRCARSPAYARLRPDRPPNEGVADGRARRARVRGLAQTLAADGRRLCVVAAREVRSIGVPFLRRVGAPAAPSCLLDRRAFDRSVRAEDAAVARPGAQQRLAGAALVEELAGIRRHRLLARESAVRTSEHGSEHDRSHVDTNRPSDRLRKPRPTAAPRLAMAGKHIAQPIAETTAPSEPALSPIRAVHCMIG
jgi:hypothetical protein